MCRGSHGCGFPVLGRLRRRLVIRSTSSTARPFYNLRPPNAGSRLPGTKKAGIRVPAFRGFARSVLLLVLAQEEQVQERKHGGQRGCYVGESRRRKHTLRARGLAAREHPVAGQEAVG